LWLNAVFGLSQDGLANGWWWQLVTHQFLHGGAVHLLVNMLMLWFVGRDAEEVYGARWFLMLYLLGGIAGGVAQIPFLSPAGVLIGASGSVCAVFMAVMTTFPRVPVTALLFFVLPIRLKAGVLAMVVVVASVALWLSGLAPGIGHAAHLGGFAFGFIFALWWRTVRAVTPGGSHRAETSTALATTRDEVVEKLLRHGLDSLTREEIRLLESRTTKRGWR